MSCVFHGPGQQLRPTGSGYRGINAVGHVLDDGAPLVIAYVYADGLNFAAHMTPAAARELGAQLLACANTLEAAIAAQAVPA